MTTRTLGEVLGVTFEVDSYPTDGFQLTLTDHEGYDLFDSRMICYTLWEAVTHAVSEAWANEMRTHNDDDLPRRVASALGIEETYDEEDN